MQLNICTFNVKNDNLIQKLDKETILACYQELLEDYKFDVLATQEMIDSTLNILKKNFKSYTIYGKKRYGNGVVAQKVNFLKKYNEHASILTRLKVLSKRTTSLPWIPLNIKDLYQGVIKHKSITPRILTDVTIELENKEKLRILNTHLDCFMHSVKKRQLNYLLNRISKTEIPIVLLGDFNSNLEDPLFKEFVEKLDLLGYKRVEYNHKTFRKSKKDLPIDHIFLPKKYKIQNFGTLDNDIIKTYSDHYPLYVTIDIPIK